MNFIFQQFKKEIKFRFFLNFVYLSILFLILFEYLNEFFFLFNFLLFSNKFHFFFLKSPINIYIFTFQILFFFFLLILIWILIIEIFESFKYIYNIKIQQLKIIKNNYKSIIIIGLIISKEINFDIFEYLNFEYQKFNNLNFLNIYLQSTIEINIIFYYFSSIFLCCVFILILSNYIKKKISFLILVFLMLLLIFPPVFVLQLITFIKFFFTFEIFNVYKTLKIKLQEEWDSNP